MVRTLLLAIIALSALWSGDASQPNDQIIAKAAVRMLKEIGRLKPDSTEVDRSNALFETHCEVRSAIAAQLNGTTPYIEAGITASGPRAQLPVRSYWAPLVEACTIDQPKEGRPLLATILANPKLPIKARGWIISFVLSNASAGQAIAWLPSQVMLQLAKDLSQVPDAFHTVRMVNISTKDDGSPVETVFTGPMLSASILQGYFSISLPKRWDDTSVFNPEVLAARTAMQAQLSTAIDDAAQRSAIAVSALYVLENWPRFSYGPKQRSCLARLMIGSRCADLALLQDVALLAKVEVRRQPKADQALVVDYMEGIRLMWEDGALPKNAAGPNRSLIGALPPLPRIPVNINPKTVDIWITESLAVMKPSLFERHLGGFVLVDLDVLYAALGITP